MVELKKLRGKSILVNGANAVNDLLILYPDLFSYPSIEQVFMEFPYDILFSLTSPDNVDTDYRSLAGINIVRACGLYNTYNGDYIG